MMVNIKTTKLAFLGQLILDCDIIIYDLTTCDPEEAEYAIKTLKIGDYKGDKTLICISNVMVWSETPPKEKVDYLLIYIKNIIRKRERKKERFRKMNKKNLTQNLKTMLIKEMQEKKLLQK